MKWNCVIGALVIGAGLCSPSYGFEWLDRLIGIDLDNSEATPTYSQPMSAYRPYSAGYAPYTMGYAPYSTGYASPATTAGYAPYSVGYPAAASNGCSTCGVAPQTSYRTVYQPVPVTSYQPVASCDSCGNQVTTLRPVITYRMQAQVVPYTVGQPVYAPATTYAPATGAYPAGN